MMSRDVKINFQEEFMENFDLWGIAIKLIGGLGLFIYGMHIMAEGLQKSAGNRLKKIVEMLTKNRIMAVGIGAVFTAIVQSSSATTVMVVGFVNAGIMNLTQAVGIIMGANIGTTITAQIVSLKLTAIAPIAIAAGVIMMLASNNTRHKKYAQILIGFGILFMGMDVMKEAVHPLRSYEGFTNLLMSFGNPNIMDTFKAILTGFAVTAVVQSSSATTGILIALASAGMLPISAAFPVLLGTNIGTCVTAMISSVGANKTAKRAAIVHLLFNIIGTVIFVAVFLVFKDSMINLLRETADSPERQLANAHTIFNIVNTVILLPFAGLLVYMANRILPYDAELEEVEGIKYLDERFLETPSIAITLVMKEVLHMGNLATKSLDKSIDAFVQSNMKLVEETFRIEESINQMEHAITDYIIKLSNASISVQDREKIDGLFSTVNDIERVGDHAENLAELAMYRIENKLTFSDSAIEEVKEMGAKALDATREALSSLEKGDNHIAQQVIEWEGNIDVMEKTLRKKHIKRLNDQKCNPSSGVIFLDLISNLERVGDHASNIALSVLDTIEGN